MALGIFPTILTRSKPPPKRKENPSQGASFEVHQHAQRRDEVAMEEKQETAKSDQEELDFDRDALDRWQDDGGR